MERNTPPDWEVLPEPFRSLFSRAGFRYFGVFVRTFPPRDRRLRVTQVVRSGMLGRHWTPYYRFLRPPAWPQAQVSVAPWRLCLPVAAGGGCLRSCSCSALRLRGVPPRSWRRMPPASR